MCDIEPSKLKVVELRAELQARGLDAKGNKAVLVQRLEEALGSEGKGEVEKSNDSVTDNCKAESDEEEDVSENAGETVDSIAEDSVEASDVETDAKEAVVLENDSSKDEAQDSVEAETPIEEEEKSPKDDEPEDEPVTDDDVHMINEEEQSSDDTKTVNKETEEDSNMKDKMDETVTEPLIKQEIKEEHEPSIVHNDAEKGQKRKWPEVDEKAEPQIKEEPPVIIDEDRVVLDIYNSDLNLIQTPNRCSAKPMVGGGFAFMWAGARASYGICSGKICFEVKVLRHLDVTLPEDEINPHVLRVGFSCDDASLLLGEEALSWGYGGTGKASTNLKFKDYGVPFAEGDVVTSFLDMSSDRIDISFAKNGRHLGSAYNFPRKEIKDKALFPHVLSKNCEFEINFGQLESPFFELPSSHTEYVFIDCVPLDDRVRGTLAPKKQDECEMIMMCGLPGSGKTTWANDYCGKHLDKRYNILGTNNIIDRMKVMGLPRKRNYAGRWEVLIQMSTKCLNKMMELGSKLCRNFILDQTNVYPSAQRRKMRSFEGFKRRAVVIVPTDDEFRQRIDKREREEGKDVPDNAVLEMKANFGLPAVGPLFDVIEYPELQRDEAEELVKKYNDEGQAATGPPKRFHPSSNRQGRWEPLDQFKDGGEGHRDRGSSDGGDSFRDRRSSSDNNFRGGSGMRGNGFRGGRGSDHRSRSPGDDHWQNSRWERTDRGGSGGGWRGGRGGDRGWRGGGRPGDDRGPRGGWNDRPPRDGGGRGGFRDRGGGGGYNSRGGPSPGRGSFNSRGGGGRGGPPPRGGRGYNSGPPGRMDNRGQRPYQQWGSPGSNQGYNQGGGHGNYQNAAPGGGWKPEASTTPAYAQGYVQSYATPATPAAATPTAADYAQQAAAYAQTYTYGQPAASTYPAQGQYAQTATQQYSQQNLQAQAQQYAAQSAAAQQQYAQAAAAQQYAQPASAVTAATTAQQQYTQQQWTQAYQQQQQAAYQSYSQYGYTQQ